MVESEERWLFYDDEETEVLVEMGNFVWAALLKELQGDLNALRIK